MTARPSPKIPVTFKDMSDCRVSDLRTVLHSHLITSPPVAKQASSAQVQKFPHNRFPQVTLEAKADAVNEVAFDTRDLKIQGVSLRGSALDHRLEDAHKVPPTAIGCRPLSTHGTLWQK
jgi:hypothetical protein